MISSKEIRLISSDFSFTDLYSLEYEFKMATAPDNNFDKIGRRITTIIKIQVPWAFGWLLLMANWIPSSKSISVSKYYLYFQYNIQSIIINFWYFCESFVSLPGGKAMLNLMMWLRLKNNNIHVGSVWHLSKSVAFIGFRVDIHFWSFRSQNL